VLTTPYGQEADERNLHTGKRAKRIPRCIADIKPWAVPAHADQNKGMQRQQVGNEHISTPSRYHVSIEQRGQRAPEHGSILNSLDPQEEGEYKQEDGYGFVVVASSD